MKTSLVIAVILLMFLFCSCMNTTPQQGQPGAQGQAGRPGQSGQTGEPGQSGQTGQTGEPGQSGQTGQTGKTGQTGQPGQDAPCPAGQHPYTNPNTGAVRCVSD